jgi:RNA polymerase sigma factor (sigma-70 family)
MLVLAGTDAGPRPVAVVALLVAPLPRLAWPSVGGGGRTGAAHGPDCGSMLRRAADRASPDHSLRRRARWLAGSVPPASGALGLRVAAAAGLGPGRRYANGAEQRQHVERAPVADAAFEEFYEEAKDPVFRMVLAWTGDRGWAEEVTAEAFARAYERWHKVRVHPNRHAWVAHTARNIYRSWWRRVARRETADVPDRSVPPPREPLGPQLRRAILALPRRQREVVVLRHLYDFTPSEIAELLDISAKTVSVHLHRAMRALRAALREPPGNRMQL